MSCIVISPYRPETALLHFYFTFSREVEKCQRRQTKFNLQMYCYSLSWQFASCTWLEWGESQLDSHVTLSLILRACHSHTRYRHTSCCRGVSSKQRSKYFLICFPPTSRSCWLLYVWLYPNRHGRICFTINRCSFFSFIQEHSVQKHKHDFYDCHSAF